MADFKSHNQDLIESNPMQYFFLQQMIDRLAKGKEILDDLFNISNGLNQIAVLKTAEVCLIYDNKYDKTLIPLLSKQLEFEKFKKFQFAGSKYTVEKLFEINHASYQTQKHRICYKCAEVNKSLVAASGSIEMAEMKRLDDLILLSRGFEKDYYGRNVTFPEAARRIIIGIQEETLYQWIDNGKLCAIAQAIYNKFEFPVIGHFYTDPAYRNKGYGSSLVKEITKGLLNTGNEFVMLQTNALTPQSNRVFTKVGYHNAGEYILAYKDNE